MLLFVTPHAATFLHGQLSFNMYRSRILVFFLAALIALTLNIVSAYPQSASPGPRSSSKVITSPNRVLTIKSLLKSQGYWITSVDSVKNEEYRHAIAAFRKVHGLKHTKQFDDAQFEVLRASSRPTPKQSLLGSESGGAHIEVDLQKQVLFVVDNNGVVTHILPVSSGNGKQFSTTREDGTRWTRKAKTPRGVFRITRKVDGWRKSELGKLYYPLYFFKGAAIHGAPSVPNVPASHGCIRIPIFAAPQLSAMIPVGHPIAVYG